MTAQRGLAFHAQAGVSWRLGRGSAFICSAEPPGLGVSQIERFGLPVTAVVPRQKSLIDTLDESDDMKRNIIGAGGVWPGAAVWTSGPAPGRAWTPAVRPL